MTERRRPGTGPALALGGGLVVAAALLAVAVPVALDQAGRPEPEPGSTSTTTAPTASSTSTTADPRPDVPVSEAVAGELTWNEIEPGLELAELAVELDGWEAERILLTRVDPARFRFEVATRPDADRPATGWLAATGAVVAVNGTYFDPDGEPVAPVVASSQTAGPASYTASHGAFVAATVDGAETAAVVDLAGTTWQDALAGAHDAMVSYPLLVADGAVGRVDHVDGGQRANRSFVAADSDGRIVIGTTITSFFSLDRLAVFLAGSPLDLVTAINLDGGPFACQAVAGGEGAQGRREFCGQYDIGRDGDRLTVPDPEPDAGRPGLPLVLLVHRATPAG